MSFHIGIMEENDETSCPGSPLDEFKTKANKVFEQASDHAGTGFRTRISPHRKRPPPGPGGQTQLPEVIEGGAGAGTAPKHVHAAVVRVVDSAVRVPLTD